MTRKKTHAAESRSTEQHLQQESRPAATAKNGRKWNSLLKVFPYLLIGILFWGFSAFTYGDIFTRAVQESFVTSDPASMAFLTSQDYGMLYWFGRYCLLIFHNVWIGSLIFSLILLGTVMLLDRAFRIPLYLHGITALVPVALLCLFVQRGIQLYYKVEPSLFLLQTLALFFAALLLGVLLPLLWKRKAPSVPAAKTPAWKKVPVGALVAIVGMSSLHYYATTEGENAILTARMQNRVLANDYASLVSDGLEARQPSRSVAAYYAIGLLQTDQILTHLFDISFHFPEIDLNVVDGTGEYDIFVADCNFFSGLVNPGYRAAMDQIVMNGPRLYYLKRMAICAITNKERKLAEKYLDIIEKVPFEKDFVEAYRPMAEQPDLVDKDYTLSKVLNLRPQEQRFEQNYRTPTFLGFYTGMLYGSNYALPASMAACLYAKDLGNFAQRAKVYKAQVKVLPMAAQEALSIYARKNPAILQYFPELNGNSGQLGSGAVNNVNTFFLTIQNYYQEKYGHAEDWRERMAVELKNGIDDELRKQLDRDWMGHYVRYYYTENMVNKNEKKKSEGSAVN